MPDFTNYTNANLSALKASAKSAEVISKKQAILDGVYEFYNFVPESVLFIGFNSAMLSRTNSAMYVTEISDQAMAYLDSNNVQYTYLDAIELKSKNFDVVVASDEYFTYTNDAQAQIDKVTRICKLAKEFVISTLRDYKNQDFKDREFSLPAVIRNDTNNLVFTEFHNWSTTNRTQWESKVYEVSNVNKELTVFGPFKRHTMYFKQLAKFSMDAGAEDFVVHKNLMYKSPIKRNYEHVISIKFDNYYDSTNRTNGRD